jgi:hypothetical protein
MTDEERIQAALASGGLLRVDGESERDFILLSHQFVQRLGSPLNLHEWENNIRMSLEGAARSFEGNERKEERNHPRIAALLLRTFLKESECEYILGDLVEEFAVIEAEWGTGNARIWFYNQSLHTIRSLIYQRIKSHPFGKWIRRP